MGEIASIFQYVYQGGGNLAERITFGRLTGRRAAAETPLVSAVAHAPAQSITTE